MFPAPAALTRHRPPALLIAEVLACATTGGRVRLLPGCGDDPLALLEAAAQAAAVLAGAAGHVAGAAPRPGALVAARAVTVVRPCAGDEALQVALRWGTALGDLRLAEFAVHDAAEAAVLRGTLTVAEGVEPAGATAAASDQRQDVVAAAASGVRFWPQREADAAVRAWQAQPPVAVAATLRFPAALALFPGHFPGRPLVPGVHLLAGVLAAVRRVLGDRWILGEVVRAKWSSAVRPEDETIIAARWQEQATGIVVDATLSHGDTVCTTCRMVLRRQPSAPAPV